ncbi:MAG TPA: glycosyltransferase, partial [Candidatus Saccharimonadia bacterium]
MKVLLASDQFWPMVSGVATAGRNLASGLAAAGHEVLVIAPSQTGHPYEETDRNYHITRTRSVPVPARENLRISVAFQNEIKRIIEEFGPDIVHVHTQLTVGLTTIRMARKLGLPIVATNHAMPQNIIDNLKFLVPVAKPVSYILMEYGPLLYKGADHIIMPTQGAIDIFKPDAFSGAPITAVSNGIDLSSSSPGPVPKSLYRHYHLPTNEPIVTYLGRLDAEKHLEVVVRALAVLRQRGEAVHGLFVGTGNTEDKLQNLASELGIAKHVTFTGRVSDEDRTLLHRVGTLYVMPSPVELQSLSTLEAMASGQPIIAVRNGVLL